MQLEPSSHFQPGVTKQGEPSLAVSKTLSVKGTLEETKKIEERIRKKVELMGEKIHWSSSDSDEKEDNDADGGRANIQEQDQEPQADIEESKDTDEFQLL